MRNSAMKNSQPETVESTSLLESESTFSASSCDNDESNNKVPIWATKTFMFIQFFSLLMLYSIVKTKNRSCFSSLSLDSESVFEDNNLEEKSEQDEIVTTDVFSSIESALDEKISNPIESTDTEERNYENESFVEDQKVVTDLSVLGKADPFNMKSKFTYFAHIPKTGGESFKEEFRSHGNSEIGYYGLLRRRLPRNRKIILGLFRDPRAHVFSQFLHCKYNPYHHKRNYTGFQKTTRDEKGDAKDFEAWLDHYNSPDFVMGKSTTWDCYNPFNMQSRYMTSKCHTWDDCHWGLPERLKEPPIELAIRNLHDMDWFGILEYFKPSLCLLRYQVRRGKLPAGCHCKSRSKPKHVKHKIHKHDVKKLNLRIKSKIDKLTRVDRQMYDVAKDILLARLYDLEQKTNTSIISC